MKGDKESEEKEQKEEKEKNEDKEKTEKGGETEEDREDGETEALEKEVEELRKRVMEEDGEEVRVAWQSHAITHFLNEAPFFFTAFTLSIHVLVF